MVNHQVVIIFLCYSINPFIRKIAITQLNDCTGYALLQFTTMVGNSLYLIYNHHLLSLNDIKVKNLQYSVGSSTLTVLGSCYMTKSLKENSVSNLIPQIQVLTIIASYLVDYLFNNKILTHKQIIGISLLIGGIIFSKDENKNIDN